jgi:hypothetical protein
VTAQARGHACGAIGDDSGLESVAVHALRSGLERLVVLVAHAALLVDTNPREALLVATRTTEEIGLPYGTGCISSGSATKWRTRAETSVLTRANAPPTSWQSTHGTDTWGSKSIDSACARCSWQERQVALWDVVTPVRTNSAAITITGMAIHRVKRTASGSDSTGSAGAIGSGSAGRYISSAHAMMAISSSATAMISSATAAFGLAPGSRMMSGIACRFSQRGAGMSRSQSITRSSPVR